jgi:hypothetical protein
MYEVLVIISALVSIALLIGFFVMFKNIAFLKYHYYPIPKELKEKYNKARYLGRDDEALHFLQEFIWESLKRNNSKKNYDALKLEYNNDFLRFGAQFPQNPF